MPTKLRQRKLRKNCIMAKVLTGRYTNAFDNYYTDAKSSGFHT